VTRLRVGRPTFDSWQGRGFLCCHRVQTGFRAHPASDGYRGLFPGGVKRTGREADHSPPSTAEIKNAWSYTSTRPYLMAWSLVKQRDRFTLKLPSLFLSVLCIHISWTEASGLFRFCDYVSFAAISWAGCHPTVTPQATESNTTSKNLGTDPHGNFDRIIIIIIITIIIPMDQKSFLRSWQWPSQSKGPRLLRGPKDQYRVTKPEALCNIS
jgi:hypothetical protein